MLIEVLDAKLSLGLSRAKRGRQIEATLGWVLSCPAGRGMETRATQCRPRVVPAQTSSNLSHPPGFGYFPTNALEGEREHKEVDFFFPYPIFKTRLGWQELPFGALTLYSGCCGQPAHREGPSETSAPWPSLVLSGCLRPPRSGEMIGSIPLVQKLGLTRTPTTTTMIYFQNIPTTPKESLFDLDS